MTNPTSNFGWQMPTPTDLVTDLPADFEVFGQAVDTSLADLQGGTTGQILAKATNADMDFAWITNDVGDITAVTAGTGISGGGTSGAVTITNSMATAITTAGDLIKGTGSGTFDRLGIGSTGQVLTVAAGIPSWATPASPGVNLLLNSNFALNQRGYVSAANLASGAYGFDRWKSNYTNTTLTFTASTQGQSLEINASGGLQQVIEQGLVPAGTYTLSWTGTATARVYNSGGTPPSYAASPVTFTADGLANVVVEFTAVSTSKTVSKVQFNAGTNTDWALATPTLQSELAACQRYFYRMANGNNAPLGIANFVNASTAWGCVFFPVTMRTAPTLTAASGTNYYMSYFGSVVNFNTLTNGNGYITTTTGQVGVSSLSGNTAGYATSLITTNAATTVDWSSEL
jgi:hypothetical protein